MREIEPGIFIPNMRYFITVEDIGNVFSNDLETLRAYLKAHTSCWNSGTISEQDEEGDIVCEHPATVCEVMSEDLHPGSGYWFNANTHILVAHHNGNWYRFQFGEYAWEGSWHLAWYLIEDSILADYQEVSEKFLVRDVISKTNLLALQELKSVLIGDV